MKNKTSEPVKALLEYCGDLIDVLEGFQADGILEYREILARYARQCEGVKDE